MSERNAARHAGADRWREFLAEHGYQFDAEGRAQRPGLGALAEDAAWFTPLTSLGALAFEGRDTIKFLQAQLTLDVAAMASGQVGHGAWCDPKGRALAVFTVAVENAESVVLVAPAAVLDAVEPRLRMFILRARTRPRRLDETQAVIGVHAIDADSPADESVSRSADGTLRIAVGARRALIVGDLPALEATLAAYAGAGHAARDEQAWWHAEIDDGRPQVWPQTMGRFVPQMANLELIGGVSFSKGCYPGQEVVARTQYLGRVKRRTYRANLPAAAPRVMAGTDVRTADGKEAGLVMQVASEASGAQSALVVLRCELVDSGAPLYLPDGDAPIEIAPPPYGFEVPPGLTARA